MIKLKFGTNWSKITKYLESCDIYKIRRNETEKTVKIESIMIIITETSLLNGAKLYNETKISAQMFNQMLIDL